MRGLSASLFEWLSGCCFAFGWGGGGEHIKQRCAYGLMGCGYDVQRFRTSRIIPSGMFNLRV